MEMREELKKRTGEVESIVDSYLPAEEGYQKTIFEAMNYSVRAGGKRLRPMLMEETYRLFGGTEKAVEPTPHRLFMMISPAWTTTSFAAAFLLPGRNSDTIWQFWRAMPS